MIKKYTNNEIQDLIVNLEESGITWEDEFQMLQYLEKEKGIEMDYNQQKDIRDFYWFIH